ncbi:MAG: YeeE/YedE family protein [Agarilytica sp.]
MNEAYMFSAMGGLLIGLSATLMLLFIGRIAGISGILNQAFFYEHGSLSPDNIWRWFFVVGILAGGYLVHALGGVPIPQYVPENYILVAVSGVLVGYGVSVGSGCTSGHGICGLSRLSTRSIAATATFMAVGVITVAVMRHLI